MVCWRRTGWWVAGFASVALGAAGCQSSPAKIDPGYKPDPISLMDLPGSMPSAARAQKPQPTTSPLELGPAAPGSGQTRGARIRAVVNGEAILDEEVVAAGFQQLMAPGLDEPTKAEILNKKLTEIIERELLLQDAAARLGGKRKGFMDELKTAANKEFEKQWLFRLMKANGKTDPEEFKRFLQDQGMPVEMIRRQWVRNFIAMEYMRSLIQPKLEKIGHLDVVDYFNKYSQDFQVEDSVVWQDIFILKANHNGDAAAARRFAESLVARVRKGEDFAKLANEFDNGDSKIRNNEGIGRKKGEILPVEVEPIVFGLKEKEIGPLIESEAGFHIVRVAKRTYAGTMPLDNEVQKQIKDKLRGKIFEKEMKQIIVGLKAKAIIEIAREIK
jgi:hypothetical protein